MDISNGYSRMNLPKVQNQAANSADTGSGSNKEDIWAKGSFDPTGMSIFDLLPSKDKFSDLNLKPSESENGEEPSEDYTEKPKIKIETLPVETYSNISGDEPSSMNKADDKNLKIEHPILFSPGNLSDGNLKKEFS